MPNLKMLISSTARNTALVLLSVSLTALTIANAFNRKKQFYPSVVYITKSNASMAAIYFQGLVLTFFAWKFVRWIFFGQLRPAEVERLVEKSWFALTETCLAFTVFRDEFSPVFVVLFVILLFLKCFHWVAEDRIDFMERTPIISRLFHIRAVGVLILLIFCDMFFVAYAYNSLVTKGVTFQLVFGFEYAILACTVLFVSIKYILHCIDTAHDQAPWESKAAILLYTELVICFMKVFLYGAFLLLMLRVHSVPLFAIRPIYMAVRSLRKALHDVVMSRRAIETMNTMFPEVPLDEIRTGDSTCIICRDEMTVGCKKLPCNHIFHAHCLRSWFQRQQTCPTCRLDIFRNMGAPRAAAPPNAPPQPNFPHQLPHGAFANHPAFGPNVAAGLPNFPMGIPPFPGFPNFAAGQPGIARAAPHPPPAAEMHQRPADQQAAAPHANDGQRPNAAPAPPPPLFAPMAGHPLAAFMLPAPPVPLPSFSSLSDEELKRMEGDSRRALELRVQHLQNIQLLMDAAVVQFSQYVSLMATNSPHVVQSNQATQSTAEQQAAASQTDRSEEATSEVQNQSAVSSGTVSSSTVAPPSPESDEVRRRRLERFAAV